MFCEGSYPAVDRVMDNYLPVDGDPEQTELSQDRD